MNIGLKSETIVKFSFYSDTTNKFSAYVSEILD